MENEKQLNESEMKIREIISNIQEEAAIKVSVYEEKLEKLRASFEVTKSKKMECEKLTVDLISLKEINANHLTILDAFEKNLKMIQINNPVNYSLEISQRNVERTAADFNSSLEHVHNFSEKLMIAEKELKDAETKFSSQLKLIDELKEVTEGCSSTSCNICLESM
jgi:hypothetical protein